MNVGHMLLYVCIGTSKTIDLAQTIEVCRCLLTKD